MDKHRPAAAHVTGLIVLQPVAVCPPLCRLTASVDHTSLRVSFMTAITLASAANRHALLSSGALDTQPTRSHTRPAGTHTQYMGLHQHTVGRLYCACGCACGADHAWGLLCKRAPTTGRGLSAQAQNNGAASKATPQAHTIQQALGNQHKFKGDVLSCLLALTNVVLQVLARALHAKDRTASQHAIDDTNSDRTLAAPLQSSTQAAWIWAHLISQRKSCLEVGSCTVHGVLSSGTSLNLCRPFQTTAQHAGTRSLSENYHWHGAQLNCQHRQLPDSAHHILDQS